MVVRHGVGRLGSHTRPPALHFVHRLHNVRHTRHHHARVVRCHWIRRYATRPTTQQMGQHWTALASSRMFSRSQQSGKSKQGNGRTFGGWRQNFGGVEGIEGRSSYLTHSGNVCRGLDTVHGAQHPSLCLRRHVRVGSETVEVLQVAALRQFVVEPCSLHHVEFEMACGLLHGTVSAQREVTSELPHNLKQSRLVIILRVHNTAIEVVHKLLESWKLILLSRLGMN